MDARKCEELMRLGIEEATKAIPEDSGVHPKVGAVLSDSEGNVLVTAHRGESGPGDHAEEILFRKAAEQAIDTKGTVMFVTLEPCTERGPGKQSCAERIRQSGVSRIYLGMLDPNPQICGRGETMLRWSNLGVERFPNELIAKIGTLNREFVDLHRSAHLPKDSLYVTSQIPEIMGEMLRRQGVPAQDLPADWGITIEDVVGCGQSIDPGHAPCEVRDLVRKARGAAFDRKYVDYSYDQDARGLGDFWKQELRDVFQLLEARDFTRRIMLLVGVGNGLEAEGMFDQMPHLTIADIAPESLKRAEGGSVSSSV